MITLNELLEDPIYREFFRTVPKTVKAKPGQLPWRVYIQRDVDGPWAKKELETYADAFRLIAKYRANNRLHDGAIQSRGIAFAPPQRVARLTQNGKPVFHVKDGKRVLGPDGKPVRKTVLVDWKPRLEAADEAHEWCTYCRRPTVVRWFRSHHSLRGTAVEGLVDPADRRCTICGAREDLLRATRSSARPVGYDPRTILTAGRKRR